jgi:hypothetical protein
MMAKDPRQFVAFFLRETFSLSNLAKMFIIKLLGLEMMEGFLTRIPPKVLKTSLRMSRHSSTIYSSFCWTPPIRLGIMDFKKWIALS